MKRGEVWTVSGGAEYAGKPRPAVILQSDKFVNTDSITLCLMTSQCEDEYEIRIDIRPNGTNDLSKPSQIMVDKMSTVPRAKLGEHIGFLGEEKMSQLESAMMKFLGLPRTGQAS